MSKAQEARERRVTKGLKAIAEVTVFHAAQDARADCRDNPSRDYDEEFELILENYKQDMYQWLDEEFHKAAN